MAAGQEKSRRATMFLAGKVARKRVAGTVTGSVGQFPGNSHVNTFSALPTVYAALGGKKTRPLHKLEQAYAPAIVVPG